MAPHIRHGLETAAWITVRAGIDPLDGSRTICLRFAERDDETPADLALWFAEVGEQTTIWAQLPDFDPATDVTEINVRQAVFYPSRPGIDFLRPEEIAGIEVYKRSATAPARYATQSSCGVVLIWTRSPGDEMRAEREATEG